MHQSNPFKSDYFALFLIYSLLYFYSLLYLVNPINTTDLKNHHRVFRKAYAGINRYHQFWSYL